jgi:integrase
MLVYPIDGKGYIIKGGKPPYHAYLVKFSYENRTYKKTFKGISEKDAKKLEAKMRMEVYSGTYGKKPVTLPFQSFVDEVYLPHVRKTIKVAYNYERLITVFCGYFKNKLLSEITTADIEGFRKHRQNTPRRYGGKRSLNTINREVGELSALFSFAVRLGYCPANPCSKVKRYKVSNRRERVLLPEEEERLLASLTGTKAKYRPLVILYLNTGMRLSEAVLLQWDWIDFEQRRIVLPASMTKNGKPRLVSLNDEALRALQELCPEQSLAEALKLSPSCVTR